MYYFKLLIDFSLVKYKFGVFYLNIVVVLGFKFEIFSLVGSVILYSYEFFLSINFRRVTNRGESVYYGVIILRVLVFSGNIVVYCYFFFFDVGCI